MWKGRVWTERSALSDCCDDGPLSSLILRLNSCLIPHPRQVAAPSRRKWGPSLIEKKVRGGCPDRGGAFQRDADMRGHFWRVGTVLFGVRGTGGGEMFAGGRDNYCARACEMALL